MWQFKDSWQERDGKERGLCSFPRPSADCGRHGYGVLCLHRTCALQLSVGFIPTTFLTLACSSNGSRPKSSKPVRRVGCVSLSAGSWIIPQKHTLPTPLFISQVSKPEWAPWMWGKKQIVLRHGSVRLSLTIAQTTLLYDTSRIVSIKKPRRQNLGWPRDCDDSGRNASS